MYQWWLVRANNSADITNLLQIYKENTFSPHGSQTANTVYLFLPKNECQKCDLLIQLRSKAALFVDGKYVKLMDKGTHKFSFDSLSRTVIGSKIAIVLHRRNGVQVNSVKMQQRLKAPDFEDELTRRRSSFFSDFSILSGALLAIWFVVLIKADQRAFLDYFNFIRLFSISERDDSYLFSKMTTSFNLVIYLFISSWLAYLMLIINFHSDFGWRAVQFFSVGTFTGAWLSWLGLSAILYIGLLSKLFLIIGFSYLYKLTEVLGLQYLNFVRLLAFLGTVLSTVLILYLLLGITAPAAYEVLVHVFTFILILWLLLLGLKLLRKASYRLFHLFSYLCPAEIFPILFLIKALIL
jgi:uncharacterized protein YueI